MPVPCQSFCAVLDTYITLTRDYLDNVMLVLSEQALDTLLRTFKYTLDELRNVFGAICLEDGPADYVRFVPVSTVN